MLEVYATPLTRSSCDAARSTKRAPMRLLSPHKNFRVERVLIAARLAGVAVAYEPADVAACEAAIGPSARSLVLLTPQGPLTQSNSVLRYIASLAPAAQLYGATEFDEALVDQWIEFAALELEVLVVALVPEDGSGASPLSEGLRDSVDRALGVLNAALARRTFVVGERLTIADVALATTCRVLFTKLISSAQRQAAPHVLRWFLTCANQPAFLAEMGAVELADEMASALGATVTAAGAAGKPKPAGGGAGGGAGSASFARCFKRGRVRVKELLAQGVKAVDTSVTVKGWVRTLRNAQNNTLAFVELNDGSCPGSIQIVVPKAEAESSHKAVTESGGTGASISVVGKVVKSQGGEQAVEVLATAVEVLGPVYGGDGGTVGAKFYPLAKKKHTQEHLRAHAHLRARARLHSSVMRLRHAMAFATHKFFNDLGFVYVHTPLITAADCEGAGEQFAVTTLLPENPKDPIKRTPNGEIDFAQDFFGCRTSLTVSGQLNVETHACALSDVYTFGPTFRAENSHTTRHLAEFWMIEPEIAFAELKDDINLAEDYLKSCVSYALENCDDDLQYFESVTEAGLRDRLRNILERPFVRLTYTEAIAKLEEDIAAGLITFENPVSWGIDMASEHERYLAEQVYKGPIVVTNYPKDIKAFYMKLDPDEKTVSAMDILVPRIGEIIGGSQREDRLDVLERRCREMGLDPSAVWWYSDLRKYGSCPHAGFGLGFERLIMLVTGVENIRDTIPFPRYPGHTEF